MTEDAPRVTGTASFDTSDLEDCLENLGPDCDECGRPWERSAHPTYGGRGKRVRVVAVAECPHCEARAEAPTGVEATIAFDVEEREAVVA